jgi:serine/threonine protein kinase/tetratricopeptide (TPR) repeat protein
MGRVWSGKHVDLDLPVAIKVVTPEKAGNPRFHESFRTEVRSVARLAHPGIVTVYDHGLIPADVGRAVEEMHAGSPYLVMELISAGTLANWRGRLDWPCLQSVLHDMLSALAHAHARGVIHRDLKPVNVLVRPVAYDNSIGAPSVVITDFGLAHALEGDQGVWSGRRAVGTPGYMAPEQIAGRWRDYGPWTDLYSLGRIARSLLRPQGDEAFIDVPREFLAWVNRTLHPDSSLRFRRAADALRSLRALGPVDEGTGEELEKSIGRSDSTGDTSTAAELSPNFGRGSSATTKKTTMTTQVTALLARPRGRFSGPLIESTETHSVQDWRSSDSPGASTHLIGSGLGLYGLRTVPLVGRERERDKLWNALSRVHANAEVELVTLRGGSGCGKSRLAQWLCERAHEEGVGTVLHGFHGSIASPQDGLGRMIERYTRSSGLTRSKVVEHLGPRLRRIDMSDPEDWLAITELISPVQDSASPVGPVLRFESATERRHLIARFLSALGTKRVAVVWIDDVQWGLDSLYFARQLLSKRKAAGRVLLIQTVREEALPAQRMAGSVLEEICRMPGASQLYIGPLEPADRQTLVRQLLGLEETLAARVESVSAGNPLFAVQIVGEWVQRGLLERGDTGFRLRPGVSVEVPDDLHQVWTGRVMQLLEGRSGKDQEALEIAAVLGQDVDSKEWLMACRRSGVTPSADLVEALLEQRLAGAHEEGPSHGWSFVHGMLRESLERLSREAGRWQRYNQVCAWIVGEQGGAGADTRTGRYLLAAGQAEQAIGLLTKAAQEAENLGDSREARILLGEREEALDTLDVPDSDPRRLEGWLLWAHCGRAEGRLDEALDWADKVIVGGKATGENSMLAEALLVSQRVARFRGESARAWRRSREAEILADQLEDPALLGLVMREQGWILQRRGDLDRSQEKFVRAIELFEMVESPVKVATCCNAIASGKIQAADYGGARRYVQRALSLLQKAGSRTLAAMALNTLGDLERWDGGNLDLAEEHYRASIKSLTAAGYGHISYSEMNLGLVLLARGSFEEAESLFQGAREALTEQGANAAVGATHALMMPCAAYRGDFGAFDQHLEEAEKRLGSMFDADFAGPICSAAQMAEEAGEHERSQRAYRLSLAQWIGLDRQLEADEVRKLLD